MWCHSSVLSSGNRSHDVGLLNFSSSRSHQLHDISSFSLVFRKLQHKNLVRLLGVIPQKGLHIITELMKKVPWTRPLCRNSLILDVPQSFAPFSFFQMITKKTKWDILCVLHHLILQMFLFPLRVDRLMCTSTHAVDTHQYTPVSALSLCFRETWLTFSGPGAVCSSLHTNCCALPCGFFHLFQTQM